MSKKHCEGCRNAYTTMPGCTICRSEAKEYHDFTIGCVLCGIQMGIATMTEEESEQLMEVVYTCRKCELEFQAGIKAIEAKQGGGA